MIAPDDFVTMHHVDTAASFSIIQLINYTYYLTKYFIQFPLVVVTFPAAIK